MKLDKPKSRYPGSKIDKKPFLKFVYEKSLVTVGESTYSTEIYYENLGSNHPVVYAYGDYERAKSEKQYQYIANRFTKLALQYPGKFYFAIGTKKENERDIKNYDFPTNLLENKNEILVAIILGQAVHPMKTAFSLENVEKHLKGYLKGNLPGVYKVRLDGDCHRMSYTYAYAYHGYLSSSLPPPPPPPPSLTPSLPHLLPCNAEASRRRRVGAVGRGRGDDAQLQECGHGLE